MLEAANPLLPGRPHARLLDMLDRRPAGRALELCAGTGYVARQLAARQPDAECHALDISPEMLEFGRRRATRQNVTNLDFLHHSADNLPFADGSLDTVFAAFGIHELPTAVREGALAETVRVLAPGGRVVIMDLDRPGGGLGTLVDAYRLVMEPTYAAGVFGNGIAELLRANDLVVDDHQPATWCTPIQYLTASKTAAATGTAGRTTQSANPSSLLP